MYPVPSAHCTDRGGSEPDLRGSELLHRSVTYSALVDKKVGKKEISLVLCDASCNGMSMRNEGFVVRTD